HPLRLRLPFAPGGGKRRLPMLAVEQAARPHRRRVVVVEAARVDAVILGVRARPIKGVYAAMPAEGVLRDAGAEGIGRQRVGAAQDVEPLAQNRQMQNALLCANRAVALTDHGLLQIDTDAKPHPAAVATALVSSEHRLSPLGPR